MPILAADIGGTHSRFALFEQGPAGPAPVGEVCRLRTAESGSLAALLARAWEGLGAGPGDVDLAALAVPGPVRDRTYCKPPNIAWDMDVSRCAHDFGLRRCLLLNDFAAQAFACRTLAVDQSRVIKPGRADSAGTLAVVGAGTGLGHCALTPWGGDQVPVASEGGHAAFAFVGPEEAEYGEFVRRVLARPYAHGDAVVSGPGLSLLHRFHTGRELAPEAVAAELTPDCPTLVWFARFYARACRNYALTVLATGGLFVSGGVAERTPALVDNDHFRAEFVCSPSHGPLLERLPVRLNTNRDSGLHGAALAGFLALERGRPAVPGEES
jgi:glucokinase